MHVADIKRFRETVQAEPYPGQPTWDLYMDRWLGLHTEVAIERTTGVSKQYLLKSIDYETVALPHSAREIRSRSHE